MSAFSMTGFGRGEVNRCIHSDEFSIITEIKTLNHRFKDFKFKMPSLLNSYELDFKSKLEQEFRRGSFDIFVSIKRKSHVNFSVDTNKVESFLTLLAPVLSKHKFSLEVKATDFLRSEFSLEVDSQDSISAPLFESFNLAIEALKLSRKKEGEQLVKKILEHLSTFEFHLSEVDKMKQQYPEMLKDKLMTKFNDKLSSQMLSLDNSRFAQELLYYLEKLEIDEEIHRAQIHSSNLRELIHSKREVGRKIDFILQELGRETNTIGSKSANSEVTANVVEMKLQLEKIREQALNLE